MNKDILSLYIGLAASDHRNTGNRGAMFPIDDAADFSRGIRFVPGEVTVARRKGERVVFHQSCGPCCWYWQFPDGSRTYHWDRPTYERIKTEHQIRVLKEEGLMSTPVTDDYDFYCLNCGNPHTKGGHIEIPQPYRKG